jgi:hypothetical protein
MVIATLPLPVPDPPAVMAIHESAVVADHGHVAVVVTATVAVPPGMPTD